MIATNLTKKKINRTAADFSNEFSALWQQTQSDGNAEERYHSWLSLLCSLIPGILSGVLVLGRSDDSGENLVPISKWPEQSSDTTRFSDILNQVFERRCALLTDAGDHFSLAFPVMIDQRVLAVCALSVTCDVRDALQDSMKQLQWGVSWLELFYRRDEAEKQKTDLKRLRSAVTLFSRVITEEGFKGAAMAFVNGLADELACERVSIGFSHGKTMSVQAFSHSAGFSHRMNMVRCVGRAMDEAVSQRQNILYPDDGEEMVVVREHRELAHQYGAGTILTIPLYGNNQYYGAITLERAKDHPFQTADVALVEHVTALSGPVLAEKRHFERPAWRKVGDFCVLRMEKLMGPGFLGRKLAFGAALGLALFFTVVRGDFRITADGVLEGEVMRAVCAPFNGYIQDATVRPGDRVAMDSILCTLDDRDLRLERLNWRSQLSQLDRQYQEAQARYNRSEVNIIGAKIQQAEAQLNLVENKLVRTRLKSPLDGVVVSGDLTRVLGALVQQGDLLFEIAPVDAYRLILKVDESRITDVQEGQTGILVLPAFPGRKFDFTVVRITPISAAEGGQNRFEVEARLNGPVDQLRPGMEGTGKILVDRRNLFSIWTRPILEKTRLLLWTWWP